MTKNEKKKKCRGGRIRAPRVGTPPNLFIFKSCGIIIYLVFFDKPIRVKTDT